MAVNLKVWPDKDPEAIKDYAVDWTALLATGETITESVWTVDDADLVIGSASPHEPSILLGVCSVWLSGGVAGSKYKVKNHITTSRGLEDERTISIKVKEQ
jgi:hypothetical protein